MKTWWSSNATGRTQYNKQFCDTRVTFVTQLYWLTSCNVTWYKWRKHSQKMQHQISHTLLRWSKQVAVWIFALFPSQVDKLHFVILHLLFIILSVVASCRCFKVMSYKNSQGTTSNHFTIRIAAGDSETILITSDEALVYLLSRVLQSQFIFFKTQLSSTTRFKVRWTHAQESNLYNRRLHVIHKFAIFTLKVLNFWKFTSYCSLKPLWSGMGEVVPARTSPTLHPPSPPTVHQLSWLSL